MAKKKKINKKRDAAVSMEFSTDTNLSQAMDTSEATVSKPVLGVVNRSPRLTPPASSQLCTWKNCLLSSSSPASGSCNYDAAALTSSSPSI